MQPVTATPWASGLLSPTGFPIALAGFPISLNDDAFDGAADRIPGLDENPFGFADTYEDDVTGVTLAELDEDPFGRDGSYGTLSYPYTTHEIPHNPSKRSESESKSEASELSESESKLLKSQPWIKKEDLISSIHVIELEDLISRRDYLPIINSDKIFWRLFCYTTFLVDKEKNTPKHRSIMGEAGFEVAQIDKTLILSGTYVKSLQKTIEDLRAFYLEASKKRENFEIVLPTVRSDEIFFRSPQKIMDLPFRPYEEIHYPLNYLECHINPYLEQFSKFIGANYSRGSRKQTTREFRSRSYLGPLYIDNSKSIHSNKVKSIFLDNIRHGHSYGFDPDGDSNSVYTEEQDTDTAVLNITWNRDFNLIYPIPPVKVEIDESSKKLFYTPYKDQTFCDMELLAKHDAPVIKTHAIFLDAFGGEMMKKLLRSKMQEMSSRQVQMKEFDKDIVRAYADFIYLTLEEFNKKYSEKDACDLVQLFKLAQTYQVEPLIHWCTNRMSLFCGPEDQATIQVLADLYDNAHLKRLAEFLKKTKEQPASAGVGAADLPSPLSTSLSSLSSSSLSSSSSPSLSLSSASKTSPQQSAKQAPPSSLKGLDGEDED